MTLRFLLAAAAVLFLATPASAQVSANHGGANGGSVRAGWDNDACSSTNAGAMRYKSASAVIEYCDASEWKLMVAASGTGTPSTPSPDDGYFVITAGSWDGDLQTASGVPDGLGAANKLCLDDLTANDWMGKSDASSRGLLTAANVEAFICTGTATSDSNPCGNPQPSTTYFFAVSGSPAMGGASFTANAASEGPSNTQNWSGTNYFDGSKTYWSSRYAVNATTWSTVANWGVACGPVNWNTTAGTATSGSTNNTDGTRWMVSGQSCSVARRLVCLVHP